ncbi:MULTISPECIES: DUF1405 domain-containing protein [unclassified Staphylococcus]|uniref:DUF1405 domain-containing protein n=1 Tax=unclassified Staphylococcus TaxID=91994 RepID=UPI0021D0A01B|nr:MULTISPECIES: DUF1405 domain-containing protein [unclassified Staphylococcus]UXR68743.1 DUF1405 domain-containing protein [Staphylococcus sp. IVB6246]UXR70800.1 DUF1405 domain-containing protein [Staphylococcus sp. IVB6240]UXR75325.1 DUF1405 domain-containing protein [Staphylococcus sp. IVB6233]UXR79528.1 DUF1405 domain-containing protein [Staphylococcus sp. IVB6218]
MSLKELIRAFLFYKPFLYFILFCNVLGTIYGYIWYDSQLSQTPWYFWPFVPDSPTATLFLSISLLLFIMNKQSAIIDTLAFVTLFKYGIWAVIMNFMLFYEDNTIYITGVMLIMSHGVMAIQALIFLPRFCFTYGSLALTMIWVIHNDVIDYVFHQYPVYGSLASYENIIGYIAFWLSMIPLLYVILKIKQRTSK